MQVTITEETVLQMPDMPDEEFFDFCNANRDHRIERDSRGRVIIMPGTGGRTGDRNSEINFQLSGFSRRQGAGKTFDSSTMFLLPSGAMRSPDAAWVPLERLRAIPQAQRDRYVPLTPDFVIELMSPSDRLNEASEKMAEWISNGCRLGWLIDPSTRTARIYHADGGVTLVEAPPTLLGEGPVEGFVLDCAPLWDTGW